MAPERQTVRLFRAPDGLWAEVCAKAKTENITVSWLIRHWMQQYVDGDETMTPRGDLRRIEAELADVIRRLGDDGPTGKNE